MTDYIIRAESAAIALRSLKEVISDGLLVAMVLKGLPSSYKPFTVVITQKEQAVTFLEFKLALRNFEETEKVLNSSDDGGAGSSSIMKVVAGSNQFTKEIRCYSCGTAGHKANQCTRKKWCSTCRSNTHNNNTCRNRNSQQDSSRGNNGNNSDNFQSSSQQMVREVPSKSEYHTFQFTVDDNGSKGMCNSFLVDTGATSHISNDESMFTDFDQNFNSAEHILELADGTKWNSMALKRGTVKVNFLDSDGNSQNIELKNTLYIPSFPTHIFSVQAVIDKGCSVSFSPDSAKLVTGNGVTFNFSKNGKLYFLNIVTTTTYVNCTRELVQWHSIMGHSNKEDLVKLEKIVDGMNITHKGDFVCEPCILGKQAQTFSRKPIMRATHPLEFVSSDVCGPIDPPSSDGFRYVISFVDNFSGYIFLYLLKNKSDAAKALKKFLSDISPIGRVGNLLNIVDEEAIKTIKSDNGGEYMGNEFKNILINNSIKHEQSAPYSPHQNGIAERGWRTLFEVGRCLLLEAENRLPKTMWPYAIMAAAHIRNRCYQRRTEQTPYFLVTGRKPDLSKLHIFGSICYTYEQKKSKLDNRSKQGIFVGYDRESPAYLVYHADTKRVLRSRCVKFTDSFVVPSSNVATTGLDEDFPGAGVRDEKETQVEVPEVIEDAVEAEEVREEAEGVREIGAGEIEQSRYERREKKRPTHLDDYVCSSIDLCYTLSSYVIPSKYSEAMQSDESEKWKEAMDTEIESLAENETFDLVPLPEGKRAVGGRWVYTIKDTPDDSEIFKARYVAKGYTQVQGTDYGDTFSPTAKITSIRVLLQIAVQHDMTIHQMDVKTAYLNAPIDCVIFMDQPEGFEVVGEGTQRLVCRLRKSLYGLKQSGRNWNNILHKFLVDNLCIRSLIDPCVYFLKNNIEFAMLLIWVDDIIIAANSFKSVDRIKALLKGKFKMKDLGPVKYFLGIEFSHEEGIKIRQSRYISKILEKEGMSQCKPRTTPCEANPSSFNEKNDKDRATLTSRKYRELVGSLIYLMTCTRPDISWVVTKLSQHLDKPEDADWVMLKHVLRYLKGTIDHGLYYQKSKNGLVLTGYSDSDWASSTDDRRSTTGFYYSLNPAGPPVSWKSKKQPTVALSSCEAEYMALSASIQEACFLDMLLKDLVVLPDLPISVYGDNQGAIALVKNQIIHKRSKHIDVRFHFIREKYVSKFVDVIYVQTDENVADVMTKPATKSKLLKFHEMLFG